jgi:hypothetical protein
MRGFADRLLSYSDALVALSFVGVSGLGIAAADPDIRCSLALVPLRIAASNIVFAAIATAIILKLRVWESELRLGSDFSERALEMARHLHFARLVIIWGSTLLVALVLYAITQDTSCTGSLVQPADRVGALFRSTC